MNTILRALPDRDIQAFLSRCLVLSALGFVMLRFLFQPGLLQYAGLLLTGVGMLFGPPGLLFNLLPMEVPGAIFLVILWSVGGWFWLFGPSPKGERKRKRGLGIRSSLKEEWHLCFEKRGMWILVSALVGVLFFYFAFINWLGFPGYSREQQELAQAVVSVFKSSFWFFAVLGFTLSACLSCSSAHTRLWLLSRMMGIGFVLLLAKTLVQPFGNAGFYEVARYYAVSLFALCPITWAWIWNERKRERKISVHLEDGQFLIMFLVFAGSVIFYGISLAWPVIVARTIIPPLEAMEVLQ